jgi:hypothetical protein
MKAHRCLATLVVLGCTSCGTWPEFHSGKATRADVLLGYGMPALAFDDDQVLVFRVRIDFLSQTSIAADDLYTTPPPGDLFRLAHRVDAGFNLFLTFDERGILEGGRR